MSQGASVQLWGPCPFKTFKKHSLFFVLGALAAGTRSQVLLSCFPSIQDPTDALCLCSGADGWGWVISSPGLPLPPRCSNSSPPTGSWGKGCSGPSHLGLVSYPFHQALGSRRCGCSLAVVLCLLVSFRESCICCIFKNICDFGRRFPLSYSCRLLGSALLFANFNLVFELPKSQYQKEISF